MKTLAVSALLFIYSQCLPAQNASLQLLDRIPLAGVTGRIDHMALDLKTGRLYIAALGNNSLEVIDLHKGARVRSIPGLSEPQGVVFIADRGLLVVANGGDGVCLVLDAESLEPVIRIDLHDDADNLRYDTVSGELFVAYGNGVIGIFDKSFRQTGNLILPGHPESFALDRNTGRMYVNVPSVKSIIVADIEKRHITGTWKLRNAGGNFPMAIDAPAHLLLIGTRRPPQIIGVDTRSGRTSFTVKVDGDPDDIFVDTRRHRVYVSCGAGYLDVLQWSDSGSYQIIDRIPTAPGARTAIFDPEMERLFLAVPKRGEQVAEIRIYR